MLFTQNDYSLSISGNVHEANAGHLATWVYPRVFRSTFDVPGFALVIFDDSVDSHDLRRIMVGLKQQLSRIHRQENGNELCYRSMGRFNQQTTTRFHLDGAPDQSFLMLGYEPSAVDSQLAMADYTRAAFDLRVTPTEYLSLYNPMFPVHERRLDAYVSRLTAFDHNRSQILCINNSRQSFHDGNKQLLGVFHQATIPEPNSNLARIVNSTMIGICPDLSGETLSLRAQQDFVETTEIAQSQYN